MDYFCYISRAKVDQMLENIESKHTDAWKESTSSGQKSGAKLEGGLGISGILNLFRGEVSYGREGTVQIEREVKRHYLEKLKLIVQALVANGEIFVLPVDIKRDQRFDHLYYHYTGRFFSEGFDEESIGNRNLVTISSKIGESVDLSLDCSLRYFSESNTPSGTFEIHSANQRFFKGEIPLTLETVFIYLHHDETRVFGTPLFLKLHADDGNLFTRI
jgi:hypothetical protein